MMDNPHDALRLVGAADLTGMSVAQITAKRDEARRRAQASVAAGDEAARRKWSRFLHACDFEIASRASKANARRSGRSGARRKPSVQERTEQARRALYGGPDASVQARAAEIKRALNGGRE